MRTAIRSISAVFSAVLIVLFAAFPASAAKCDLRQKADETIRSWGDDISQTFCVDGITRFRRLSDDEVEDILTITVGVPDMEDSMGRDDAISAVLDSLKLLDD